MHLYVKLNNPFQPAPPILYYVCVCGMHKTKPNNVQFLRTLTAKTFCYCDNVLSCGHDQQIMCQIFRCYCNGVHWTKNCVSYSHWKHMKYEFTAVYIHREFKGADMDYRDHLAKLHLLPLMMEFEIADIIFLVKSLKYPSDHFNIVQFSVNHTCSSTCLDIPIRLNTTSISITFLGSRILYLHLTLVSLYLQSKPDFVNSFVIMNARIIIYVHVTNALSCLFICILIVLCSKFCSCSVCFVCVWLLASFAFSPSTQLSQPHPVSLLPYYPLYPLCCKAPFL